MDGHEGLAEISRPSGQQHLQHLLPNLPAFRRATDASNGTMFCKMGGPVTF
jgi:hypothetical protein